MEELSIRFGNLGLKGQKYVITAMVDKFINEDRKDLSHYIELLDAIEQFYEMKLLTKKVLEKSRAIINKKIEGLREQALDF